MTADCQAPELLGVHGATRQGLGRREKADLVRTYPHFDW